MNVTDYPELIPENMEMQPENQVQEETLTRKEYLDTLTEYGAAGYLNSNLNQEILSDVKKLEAWFKTEVDRKWGMEVEQA